MLKKYVALQDLTQCCSVKQFLGPESSRKYLIYMDIFLLTEQY